jgi:hypothetical protein
MSVRPSLWNTNSEYEILTGFPRQQKLRKRPSLLRLFVHFVSFLTNSCQFSADDNACGQWHSYGARAGGAAAAGTKKLLSARICFQIIKTY